MKNHLSPEIGAFVSPEERRRLLRLCTAITHNGEVAEDLVQETLVEAWRHEQSLRDPVHRSQWLSGIARHVAQRWLRRIGREATHLMSLDHEQVNTNLDTLENDFDVEVELERKELVELLDRAMALLSAEARAILVKRYIDESPLSDIATQLDMSTGAVTMRLQRGKLALRRILLTTLRHEFASYIIPTTSVDDWEETPLWCHICGHHRLRGKRSPNEGKLLLTCPACHYANFNHVPFLRGVQGYKPLYRRLVIWANQYYSSGLRAGIIPCVRCGRTLPVLISRIADLPEWVLARERVMIQEDAPNPFLSKQEQVVCIPCPICQISCTTSLEELALGIPAGWAFMQSHPRIRALPIQVVHAEGRPALVTRFASLTDRATFAAIFDATTYQVIRTIGGSADA